MRVVRSMRFLVGIVFLSVSVAQAHTADLLIFSYNRPLQLYALLESLQEYVTGIGEIRVLIRADNAEYVQGYQEVATTFKHVKLILQGENPREDFRPLTLHLISTLPSPYILFAVDDMVVTDYVDVDYCINMLEKTKAYGFYLRLGFNLDTCYMVSKPQKLPVRTQVDADVYQWTFDAGEHDWGYPNTVDLTLYRTAEVLEQLKQIPFNAPNSLEGHWAGYFYHSAQKKTGLCFSQSKVVNLPLNKVQHEYNNVHMNCISAQELLHEFNNKRNKMDIKPLFKVRNRAAHMEYVPTFEKR